MTKPDCDLFPASVMAADWPAPPGVHAFTTLRGPAGASLAPFDRWNLGIRNGDDAVVVQRNRADLIASLGLPSPPCWLRQTHGTKVIAAERPTAARDQPGQREHACEAEADAAIARMSGTVLAILTADCLPVLFCSLDGDDIGAAHAGWRGLASGVLEATIAAMWTPPHRLLAWLGPAAGPRAYEVGGEVRATFVHGDVNAARAFVSTRAGHWLCDLYALARMRLARAGVEQVFGGDLCTITDPHRFYSHRRDHVTGRMATLIWRI